MKIEGYEIGKIDIEGKSYTSDVIITADQVRDQWWRKEGHRLHREDLSEVIEARPDVVVVGTGYYGRMRVPNKTESYLDSPDIS